MAAVLLFAILLAVFVAACGGGSSGDGTTGGDSSTAGGGSPLAAGERTFEETCSSCHTLAAAGATGEVGPDLDELEPSQALVEKQVTDGGGGMPAFGGTLSKEEIADVAKFVSGSAGAS
ncbi:MAG: cytochrome c [Actinobacteria bacterium]|nr:cytochrome c [Actinomycetota bacterium]